MVALIDIDVLKIKQQNKNKSLKAKNLEKLRTASLNSKFTGSLKKKCTQQ